MKKETKIFVLLIVISVAVLTALDIQTKGKITRLLGSVNPMNLKSSDVPYTNNSQSTVQGAIDNLYTKSTKLNNIQNVLNDFIDTTTLKKNSAGNVFASKKGVCIKRNNTVHCFAPNNYIYEKEHIQQVFSDISCAASSSYVDCVASDFYCAVNSSGELLCRNRSDYSDCRVSSDGSVNCD